MISTSRSLRRLIEEWPIAVHTQYRMGAPPNDLFSETVRSIRRVVARHAMEEPLGRYRSCVAPAMALGPSA